MIIYNSKSVNHGSNIMRYTVRYKEIKLYVYIQYFINVTKIIV